MVQESAAETEAQTTAEAVPPAVPAGFETNITAPIARELLTEIAAEAEAYDTLAISWTDADGAYYYRLRGGEVYESASTVKAAYCQYLLASGASLTEELTLHAASRTSTSGKLTAAHVGERFTAAELIGHTIRASDNMAYRLLFERFGADGFNEYIRSLGLDGPLLPQNYEFTDVTADQLTACMREIYAYAARTGDDTLVEHLKNTTYNAQLAAGTQSPIAHKYGYQGGTRGFHDTAIVYADTPYILTIMSRIDPSDGAGIFARIAALTERLAEALADGQT